MAGFQNILIVEDELKIRELYTSTLTKAGFKIAQASNAAETFDILKTFQPDVILLDIMLPEVSGIDIFKKLRTDPQYNCQTTKIVFITNFGQENLAESAMADNADGYIIKADILPTDLVEIVHLLEAEASNTPPSTTPIAA